MKNKNVLTKILIFSGILVSLLLLMVIFTLVRMIVPEKETVKSKEIISQSYSLSDIENVTFDFKKSNAIFKISNNQELVIVQNSKEEKFYLNHKQKDKNYYFEEDSYLINLQKKKYTIYFPQDYLNKVTIINGFGEINIAGIANDIDINNNSGSIVLKETGNIKIKDVSGDISFKNVVGDIEVSSSTGNITIENINGKLNLETITGNIEVNKFMVTGDSSIESVSGNIVVRMNEKAECHINTFNEVGKTKRNEKNCMSNTNIINIKNITGIIDIY